MAFVFWSFKMIIVYRRQIERYDEQILQVRTNAEEVFSQVAKYETGNAEKKAELERMRSEAEGLDRKEKELDDKVKALKSTDETRYPTRFRLDRGDSAG
jgi:chromosome segregation ATPase